jgi:hypothetical protein
MKALIKALTEVEAEPLDGTNWPRPQPDAQTPGPADVPEPMEGPNSTSTLLDQASQLDAREMEQLITGLAQQFTDEDGLNNMNAMAIATHLRHAASLIRRRTGN